MNRGPSHTASVPSTVYTDMGLKICKSRFVEWDTKPKSAKGLRLPRISVPYYRSCLCAAIPWISSLPKHLVRTTCVLSHGDLCLERMISGQHQLISDDEQYSTAETTATYHLWLYLDIFTAKIYARLFS